MTRNFDRLARTFICQRWLGLAVVCGLIAAAPSNSFSQDDSVKPASSKSETAETPPIDEKHPLYKLLEIAYQSRKRLEPIEDYECEFAKKELLGKKMIKSTMKLKFRESPFSVYLKFLDLNKGREVIYVHGQNGNNFWVHEAGVKAVLGTFSMSPTSSDALAENKYPITDIGLKNMLNKIIKQWETEGKFGSITTQKRPDSKTPNGEICTIYESVYSKPFKEFKYHTTRLWIEDTTGLAIGVQQLGFPGKNDKEPPIVEEYFYSKVKLNLKLTDAEFDKNNSHYTFK